jgi:chemotaxis response regulator CheB
MHIRQIVVVGTSAGGIEALRELVGGLPGDFPAVKQLGGIAIAQDPADALSPSMPQSALEYASIEGALWRDAPDARR